jgi:hypothetical protein
MPGRDPARGEERELKGTCRALRLWNGPNSQLQPFTLNNVEIGLLDSRKLKFGRRVQSEGPGNQEECGFSSQVPPGISVVP